jgi:hypothetical protein
MTEIRAGKLRSAGFPVSERTAHLNQGARLSWEHPDDPHSPGAEMWRNSVSPFVKQMTPGPWAGAQDYAQHIAKG